MADDSDTVVAVRMPQANVNDETVTLIGWHVADGGRAVQGQPLCEIETSKSVGDVPAPASGFLRHRSKTGDIVAVAEVFAYIGPSLEMIDQHVKSQAAASPAGQASADPGIVQATAGAVELARRYGIDPAEVTAPGKVRRADVERFIAERGLGRKAEPGSDAAVRGDRLPPALVEKVSDEGELSGHQWAMAQHLARSQSQLVAAHVVMDVSMRAAIAWMEARRQAGVVTGPVPVLLHAAAAAIAKQPRLASFRLGRRVYRYRSIDLAYTARSSDGRLFTPVVRHGDKLTLDELAGEIGRLSMAVFRGQLAPADMSGGCLTVSALSEHPVRFHIGLQNAYQSAILTAGAIRDELALIDGRPVAIPTMTLTLSYDHGLMDGWQAADALAAARTAIESIAV